MFKFFGDFFIEFYSYFFIPFIIGMIFKVGYSLVGVIFIPYSYYPHKRNEPFDLPLPGRGR